MPVIIRTLDEIMRKRQADAYVLHFNIFARDFRAEARRQIAWFDEHQVAYEVAAPNGWLEGDPGCYAVYFDDHDDPRLAGYSACFEDENGGSLRSELYQMYLMPFEIWAERN